MYITNSVHQLEELQRFSSPNFDGKSMSLIYNNFGKQIIDNFESRFYKIEDILLNQGENIHANGFKKFRSFLSGIYPVDDYYNVNTEETHFIKKIFKKPKHDIQKELDSLEFIFKKIIEIISTKADLSFISLSNYWINMASKSSDEDLGKIERLKVISDNHAYSSEYKNIVNEYEEISTALYFDKRKKKKYSNFEDIYKKYRTLFQKIYNILENTSFLEFINFDSFKKDMNEFQDIIISMNLTISLDVNAFKFLNNQNRDFNIDTNPDVILYCSLPTKDYYSIIFFIDGSILIKKDKSSHYELFYDYRKFSYLIHTSFYDYIKYMTRKNPTISKEFIKMNNKIRESNRNGSCSFYDLLSSINYYFEHENALKQESFDIISELKAHNSFEKLTDHIYAVKKSHMVKKYSKSLLSNKYAHLYSNDLIPLFEALYTINITTSYLQDVLGKKMATFKTPTEFYLAVERTLNLLNEFTLDIVSNKITDCGAKIISKNNNKLIVRIENFEQSKKLGSPSWCISRSENYFNRYVFDGNEQYFLYDFNKTTTDIRSVIGCTLDEKRNYVIGFYKNDTLINDFSFSDYIINKVKYSNSAKNILLNAINSCFKSLKMI